MNYSNSGIDKARERFDIFLLIMDDQLEALEAEGEKHGITISQTMESLEKLELLFFKLTGNSTEDERNSLIVSFARYVGEIVRTTFDGKWHLSLEDPKNVYYNSPVIISHTPVEGLEFSPIYAMRALWLRKKHGLLRKIIMADIKPRDLQFEPEE